MGALSPTHWLIIVAVLVLLFGAKRLPDAARSLGRSARILKSEVKELHPDSKEEPAPPAAQAPPAAIPPVAPVTVAPVVASPAPVVEPVPVPVSVEKKAG